MRAVRAAESPDGTGIEDLPGAGAKRKALSLDPRVIIRKCEAALVNQSGMAVTNRYKNPKLSEG